MISNAGKIFNVSVKKMTRANKDRKTVVAVPAILSNINFCVLSRNMKQPVLPRAQ